MRIPLAGLGPLLLLLASCTYSVEMPEDDPGDGASPGVTAAPAARTDPAADPHAGLDFAMPTEAASARAEPPSRTVDVGRGFKLRAPEAWQPKVPANSMVQSEFSIPPAEGDEAAGRATVMTAKGSIEANIDRWIGQFSQPDGSDSKDKTDVAKIEVAGMTVHLVDISGTYSDSRGMMGPVVQRPGYRMLAAIIQAPDANYFVKFYGPAKTVAENADAFRAMIEGIQQSVVPSLAKCYR